MTDPSYAGQTVCFTAVHVGNTGINEDDMESAKAWLDGIIIRSLSPLARRPLHPAAAPHRDTPPPAAQTRALRPAAAPHAPPPAHSPPTPRTRRAGVQLSL